jgi:hypothetical protein
LALRLIEMVLQEKDGDDGRALLNECQNGLTPLDLHQRRAIVCMA